MTLIRYEKGASQERVSSASCVSSGVIQTDTLFPARLHQLITAHQPEQYHLAAALASFNQAKNRTAQFVPPERWRVHLAPRPGVEGSDYVNASVLLGA